MSTCLFCRIAAGEIPAKIVHSDESCIAFHDIGPQAPVHILVIPKKHFASALDAAPADEQLIGHLYRIAGEIAKKERIEGGFRIVTNAGPDAGQTVFHLHLHLLGGRSFKWPPG